METSHDALSDEVVLGLEEADTDLARDVCHGKVRLERRGALSHVRSMALFCNRLLLEVFLELSTLTQIAIKRNQGVGRRTPAGVRPIVPPPPRARPPRATSPAFLDARCRRFS